MLFHNGASDLVYFYVNYRVIFGDEACVWLQGPDNLAAFFLFAMRD